MSESFFAIILVVLLRWRLLIKVRITKESPILFHIFDTARSKHLGEFGPVEAVVADHLAKPFDFFGSHGSLFDFLTIAADGIVASRRFAHVGPVAADLLDRLIGQIGFHLTKVKPRGNGSVEKQHVF